MSKQPVARRRKADFSIRRTRRGTWVEHNDRMQREVASLGIDRSSDASVLFEAFARRFPLVEMPGSRRSPRSIQDIANTNGGNSHELAFVLHHLFMWNDIDADVVDIYSDGVAGQHEKFTSDNCEHELVYVPAIKRYFDPTLRIDQRLKEAGIKWVAERPRIHHRRWGHVSEGYFGNAFYRALKKP